MPTQTLFEVKKEHLKLTPLDKNTLEFIRTTRNNPNIRKHLFNDVITSKGDQAIWFKKYLKDIKKYLFTCSIDHKPIGYCQVSNINNVRASCEVGINILPEYQNKGYGTTFLKHFVNHVIKAFQLSNIYLKVFATNDAAMHVYRQCGFRPINAQKEGSVKESAQHDIITMKFHREAK